MKIPGAPKIHSQRIAMIAFKKKTAQTETIYSWQTHSYKLLKSAIAARERVTHMRDKVTG